MHGRELAAGRERFALLDDRASLDRAVDGRRAVFSVQLPQWTGTDFDYDLELSQVRNRIDASRSAGVEQFVQSTTSGAGQHIDLLGIDRELWATMKANLDTKSRVQDLVTTSDIARWTLIKPAFFMDNFRPSMRFLFPRGVEGGLVSVVRPEARLALVAGNDVGTAAAHALLAPSRFAGVQLELASDYLSMREIAATLSAALVVSLTAPDLSEAEALERGMPFMGRSHDYLNEVGQPARPAMAEAYDIPLTSFRDWVARELADHDV